MSKNIFKFYFYFFKKRIFLFSLMSIIDTIAWPIDILLVRYFSKVMIDRATEASSMIEIFIPMVFWVLSRFLFLALERSSHFISAKIIPETNKDIRSYFLDKVHKYSYDYYISSSSGVIIDKIRTISSVSRDIRFFVIEIFIPINITLLLSLFMIYRIDLYLFYSFLLWFISYILLIFISSGRIVKLSKESEKVISDSFGKIQDSFSNFINVKLFDFFGREKKYFDRENRIALKVQKKSQFGLIFLSSLLNLLDVVFSFLIFTILIKSYISGTATIGTFVFIIGVHSSLSNIMSWLSREIPLSFDRIQAADSALKYVLDDDKFERLDGKDFEFKGGKIEFKDISLSFNDEQVIKGFNLSISPKEKLGIVGLSGGGKSSLLRMLLGFIDFEGNIFIDDQDIRAINLNSLRKNISYISQKTTLFNRTLEHNILYSVDKKNEDDLYEALELSDSKEFIDGFKLGIKTKKSDTNLSGGQAQRIAIARAILKKSPILIMDEATSALDNETEKNIQKSLNKYFKDKTVIVVAHRLSTIKDMDRIIVLDNGKLIEEGTHEKLLKSKGKYYDLWMKGHS